MCNESVSNHYIATIKLIIFGILGIIILVIQTWTFLYYDFVNMISGEMPCDSELLSRSFLKHLILGAISFFIINYVLNRQAIKVARKEKHMENVNKTKYLMSTILALFISSFLSLVYFFIQLNVSLQLKKTCSMETWKENLQNTLPIGLISFLVFFSFSLWINLKNKKVQLTENQVS